MPTQFDDAFLARLAQELVGIRLGLSVLRQVFQLLGVSVGTAVDDKIAILRQTPEFQQERENIFHMLQGLENIGPQDH